MTPKGVADVLSDRPNATFRERIRLRLPKAQRDLFDDLLAWEDGMLGVLTELATSNDALALHCSEQEERIAKLERERNRLVCSECGDDFEPGDWDSTDCCSCDPVPADTLPALLKTAREENDESVEAYEKAEARCVEQAKRIAELEGRDG